MNVSIDLGAPILAGHSLGGFALRDPIEKYAKLLFELWPKRGTEFVSVVNPMEIRYQFLGLNVGVDAFTGYIFKLSALHPYHGSFSGVTVGMNAREAGRLLPGLYFDETDSLFRVRELDGISLEVALDDPLEHEAWQANIAFITVLAVDHYQLMRSRQWQHS